MKKSDFEGLAIRRAKEAEALLKHHLYPGAYYLVGYCIECALKACIAKQVKQYEIPEKNFARDFYTHDLNKLVRVAGLEQELRESEDASAPFKLNWAVVSNWKEESRYVTEVTSKDAEDLVRAITDPENGILPWLKKFG